MTETYAAAEIHAAETTADITDAQAAAGAEALDRPEWLPAKFKTAADMAKAYAELERKQGGKPATPEAFEQTEAEPEQQPAEKPAEQPAEVTYGAAVDAALAKAGIKPADLNAHWIEHKAISEDHFKAFEDAGYPRALVEAYVHGAAQAAEAPAKATAEAQGVVERAVFEVVGGTEAYEVLRTWAAETLPAEALTAYNSAVSGTDPHIAELAVRGLMAKRAQAVGGAKLVFGATPKAGGGGLAPFASLEDQMAAYQRARASGDERQMAAYERRALRSNFA